MLLAICCVTFIAATNKLPKVLIFGYLIASGYLYVKEILKNKAIVALPLNENGETVSCEGTTRGVLEIEKWIGKTKWDVIHFDFGLHGIKHINPETGKNSKNLKHPQQANSRQYEKNLKIIIEKLKETGATLIFATTTPYPDKLGNQMRTPGMPKVYNKVALKTIKANDIVVDDLYSFVLPRMEELQRPNNVHFTEAGNKAFGEQVA